MQLSLNQWENMLSSPSQHIAARLKQKAIDNQKKAKICPVLYYFITIQTTIPNTVHAYTFLLYTAEAGRVRDGSLGQWLGLNSPSAENESRSLTYPGGSLSSRLREAWQVSVHGRHELWQLRLAGHANLHFTPEHMSRWGLFPLGCTGVFPFP